MIVHEGDAEAHTGCCVLSLATLFVSAAGLAAATALVVQVVKALW